MPRKKYPAEQIISMLREAEVEQAKGATAPVLLMQWGASIHFPSARTWEPTCRLLQQTRLHRATERQVRWKA